MKPSFSLQKLLLILAAIVVVSVALLVYGFNHPQGGASQTPSVSSSSTAVTINCLQSPEYLVVDRNPGTPGLDLIVKHKTSVDQLIACTDLVASSDVVVQNDLPEFVLGLTEHFLIVDSGTAPPPRGLVIYDLDIQTSTYTDTYSEPITIATGTVTYWASTKQVPTLANCPDLAQYKANGLGAVIESHVILDLSMLSKKALGESRCGPTQ